MRFDLVTLFPEMFDSVLSSSILKRAAQDVPDASDPAKVREAVASYHLHNPRDFAGNKHGKIDDTPYGGGPGMVMQCQPIYDCVASAESQQPELKPRRIAFTPTGKPMTQALVEQLASEPRLLLLCGHYEGFDQRVLDELQPTELSMGDYVLTGGELPAMVLIDAIVRLLPGVLGKAGSHDRDSFSPGLGRLLDHPHYTRPPTWKGRDVPGVLLSGDHEKIDAWRREQSHALTRERRPDLFAQSGQGPSPVTTIALRDANESDHDAIDQLLRLAFETDAEANLVQTLREHGDAPIELVAEALPARRSLADAPPDIVGHILFSPLTIENSDGRLRALGLAPLTVHPDHRQQGIGKALVRQGLGACKDASVRAVFVLGEPDYYQPLGFQTASKHGFSNTFNVDQPFMVHPLKPLAGSPGLVRYAPAFDG